MDFPGRGRDRGTKRPAQPFDADLGLDFAPPSPPASPRPREPASAQRRPARRVRRAVGGPRRGRPRQAGPPKAPRRRGKGSETLARIAWAIPWIVFAIAIVAAGGIAFTMAMIGFATIGMAELFAMAAASHPLRAVAFVAVVGLALAAHFGSQYQMVMVGLGAFPVMFVAAAVRPSRAGITASMAMTTFAVVWIGVPFAHAILLRDLPDHGGALVIDVLVGTFLADTAAYAGGRLFGRRPLAPRLSPKKTVEGLIAGIVGGTFAFWFAGLYQDWLSGVDALVIGFAVALVAPIGDLFASMVKRDFDVKDTGRVFGPHGGLLDRLDAVLFTIVVGYYLAVALVY